MSNNKLSLNLANMLQNSGVNGPGNRDIFWTQGCAIHCPGCFNKHLWDFKPKYVVSVTDLLKKMETRVGLINGVSILGGEPMHQAKAFSYFLEGIQQLGLTVVLYTGFTYEYLIQQNNRWINKTLANTDLLVDGPYRQKLQDKSLVWRGSTNQRIILLSAKFKNADIPTKESYHHQAELHIFNKNASNELTYFQTGIL